MVGQHDSIIDIVKRYVAELEKHHIPVREAILYGSYANGRVREEGDIDVALVSVAFTGDRFEDRRRIVPLRRKSDIHMKFQCALGAITLLMFFLLPLSVRADSSETSFTQKREQMVEQQIRARGIKDPRVIHALLKVKRHLFVPPRVRHLAYEDHPLPIGEGQTISQPYIVALMTELLALKGGERILEIGTGSGYQAAVLAELTKEVYTIEIMEPLARQSEKLLKEMGYSNIRVKFGDGFLGWPEFSPFDGIIVTCAPEKIPPPLLGQLAEGGRLVIPVGVHWQDLKLVRKIEGRIKETDVIPVRFVPMLREK